MSPAVLASTGFPQRMRAFIAAPGQATYVSGGSQSELDLFVVSEALRAALVSVKVLDGANVPKHCPVMMFFTGEARSDTVLTLARPPRRPAGNPHGCMPDPAGHRVSDEERATHAGAERPELTTEPELDD